MSTPATRKVNVRRFADNKATTSVVLSFEEDGDTHSDAFKLRYRAVSPRRQRELDGWAQDFDREHAAREKARTEELDKARAEDVSDERLAQIAAQYDEAERFALCEYIVKLEAELPEIVDDEDRPVTLTAELLSTFEVKNLVAIREAIHKDINPNVKPSAA